MAQRGSILVNGPDVALAVSMQGESPQRYFSRGSELVLRAGDVEIGRTPVDDDFAKVFVIPAGTLGPGPDGVSRILTLKTNQVMVPADRGRSADRRELGLRVFQVAVSRASDQGDR